MNTLCIEEIVSRLGFKVVEHMKWLMAREETKR